MKKIDLSKVNYTSSSHELEGNVKKIYIEKIPFVSLGSYKKFEKVILINEEGVEIEVLYIGRSMLHSYPYLFII